MAEQWDGECPRCGNTNHDEVDDMRDEFEYIQWLECCDCGHEFSIELIWFLRDEPYYP